MPFHFHIAVVFITLTFKNGKNWWYVVAFNLGPFGTMAEGEFQWGLHRVDSHKSSTRVCGVGAQVSCLAGDYEFINVQMCILYHQALEFMVTLYFIDMGCQSTSRLCCFSPTRRTWRNSERCCTTCTSTWTAVLQSLTWVSAARLFITYLFVWFFLAVLNEVIWGLCYTVK